MRKNKLLHSIVLLDKNDENFISIAKKKRKIRRKKINSRRQVSSMHWDILLKTSSSYGLL